MPKEFENIHLGSGCIKLLNIKSRLKRGTVLYILFQIKSITKVMIIMNGNMMIIVMLFLSK